MGRKEKRKRREEGIWIREEWRGDGKIRRG
jgi:hypothetical protein